MSNLSNAVDQIKSARAFTKYLLEGIEPGDWFRMPREGTTHLAWQVGHLAVAQLRLGTAFLRELQPDESEWFAGTWPKLFGRGSTPVADASVYPSIEAIRAEFDRVHEKLLGELQGYTDEQLEGPVLVEHRTVRRKIEALFWCAQHEAMHAGQIALLRRLMGMPARW